MNERIRKLAEEAGFYFYDMHNVNGEDLGESVEADSFAAADKFAELIVRECAQFIFVLDAEPVSHKSAARMLQDHFGIK